MASPQNFHGVTVTVTCVKMIFEFKINLFHCLANQVSFFFLTLFLSLIFMLNDREINM